MSENNLGAVRLTKGTRGVDKRSLNSMYHMPLSYREAEEVVIALANAIGTKEFQSVVRGIEKMPAADRERICFDVARETSIRSTADRVDTRMDWQDRVVQWAKDRNLIDGSFPRAQFGKLCEEVRELQSAILLDDREEAADAVGDCCVVLCIIGAQMGIDFDAAQEIAWNAIKDRTGRMVDGVFEKDEQAVQDQA